VYGRSPFAVMLGSFLAPCSAADGHSPEGWPKFRSRVRLQAWDEAAAQEGRLLKGGAAQPVPRCSNRAGA
jgi:hypothetical protein